MDIGLVSALSAVLGPSTLDVHGVEELALLGLEALDESVDVLYRIGEVERGVRVVGNAEREHVELPLGRRVTHDDGLRPALDPPRAHRLERDLGLVRIRWNREPEVEPRQALVVLEGQGAREEIGRDNARKLFKLP